MLMPLDTTTGENTLEIARFRADPTEEFLAVRAEAMAALAARFAGFVSSRLIRNADGSLADEIVWTSREHAHAAAENAPSIPECGRYFGLITEVISMEHAEILTVS